MKKITAWSISRLADYELCPAKFKYKYIDDLPEQDNPKSERGIRIHKLAQHYIRGVIEEIPTELIAVTDWLKFFRYEYKQNPNKVKLEFELALNNKWKSVDWFAKDAWLRLKIDVLFLRLPESVCVDWKTGRYKKNSPEYKDQLELYTLGILSAKLSSFVKAMLVFTENGETEGMYTDDNSIEEQKLEWERRAKILLTDTVYKPHPGNHCRWCSYSKEKSGPCPF